MTDQKEDIIAKEMIDCDQIAIVPQIKYIVITHNILYFVICIRLECVGIKLKLLHTNIQSRN